jgi:hypothetical protein
MDDLNTARQNGAEGSERSEKLPATSGKLGQKIYGRDALTNGSKTLPDTDGRLRIARRFRGIANAVLADQGGASECSESRRQLIRRFSAACVLAEELEGRLARGEEIDVERHALLCSTLTRLAQRIGIDRRAKNITPSLGDYLRSPPPTEIEEAVRLGTLCRRARKSRAE